MKKTFWIIALIVLAAAGLACNLPLGMGGTGSTAEEFPDIDSDAFSVSARDALLEPEPLSSAQRQILAAKGTPNRFTILFSGSMREETWYYDYLGYEVTFRNGDVFTEGELPVSNVSTTAFSIYAPWEFTGAMGLSELLTVSGSESFAVETLDEVFEGDASLVYMDGLDAGFRDDRLVFIRALPLRYGELSLPVEGGLTPEEASHQGTHTYQVYCEYSDGMTDEYTDTKTWAFEGDGVNIDDTEFVPRIAENYYGFEYDGGEYYFMFAAYGVNLSGGFFEEDEAGLMDYITYFCTMILDE